MTEDQFKRLLEQNNATLLGQLTQYLDRRFEERDKKLDTGLSRIYTALDGIATRLDTDEEERAAINMEQERQNGWISQLAHSTSTKLVPEQ
jgi:hypothetical protein